MKRVLLLLAAMLAFTAGAYPQGTPPAVAKPTPTPFTISLKLGDEAPDFTLPGTDGQKTKLSDFRGKSNVVLAFYVFAFTGG